MTAGDSFIVSAHADPYTMSLYLSLLLRLSIQENSQSGKPVPAILHLASGGGGAQVNSLKITL